MANKFEVATIFKAVDKMTAPITRIQNKIGIMTRSADRNLRRVKRTTEGWVRGLKKVGKAAIVGSALVTSALLPATAAGIEFEQTIVNATAKMGEGAKRGTESFKRIEEAAKRTGAITEFNATQAAEAVNFLAMAGFNAEQAIAALPGVVDLATASSVDLATATDIATDSLGALGLMTNNSVQLSKNLTRVNDVLAKTTTSANVSMEDMFEAIKDGAPVGVAAGQNFETIATLIAKMGDAGIKGTRAGTALKNIFLAMGAPGSEAAEVMRRLGVQTVDAEGNIRDAIAVFKEFSKATERLPSARKLAVFDRIFGKIPIAAALNITAAADSMDEFRNKLLNAEGAANDMATTMRDTTRGSINALKSAIEGVSITLFAMNRGPLKEAIDNATKWVRANGDIIAQNIGTFFLNIAENIDKVVSAGKKIVTVVAILWTVNTVLGVITTTLKLVGIVMAANPIGLAVAAIALGATAIMLAWAPVKSFFANLWEGISIAFDATIGKILDQIEAVKRTFSEFEFSFESKAERGRPHAFATGGMPNIIVQTPKAPKIISPQTQIVSDVTAPKAPKISSPQARQVAMMEERRTTNTTEVVLRDETGRAEAAPSAKAMGITVQQTGGF